MNESRTILKAHNLKATPQRLAILEAIEYYGHISIDNLFMQIRDKFSTISQATIYKNINSMKDSFLLQEVKLPNQKSVYEITKENHSHFMCNNCGEVIDIDIDISNELMPLSSKYNFSIQKSDLILSGNCQKCQN